MSSISGITLPAPINWVESGSKAKAEAHLNKLDDILKMTISFKGVEKTYGQLYHDAFNELLTEAMDQPGRRGQIVFYLEENFNPTLVKDSMKKLLTKWLTFTPPPAPKTAPVKITPETGGPGFYIELWDYIVNTENGLYLANGPSFKSWFSLFLGFHGDWINSTSSISTIEEWVAYPGTTEHPFDIDHYEVPANGFLSFNQFFLRNLKAGQRPLCTKGDPVVSPCDGGIFYLYNGDGTDKNPSQQFNLPGKSNDPFNIKGALPEAYGDKFVGGQLLDILLWFTDYHHFHAPVNGNVVAHGLYPGSYNYDFDDYNPYNPQGPLPPADGDRVGWYKQLAKHQRYYWIIETKDYGYVAMIAIGFWGVGSIINAIKQNGDNETSGISIPITQGQYMGHFGYGGSSIVLAFEPQYQFDFKVNGQQVGDPDHPVLMQVRGCLGNLASGH